MEKGLDNMKKPSMLNNMETRPHLCEECNKPITGSYALSYSCAPEIDKSGYRHSGACYEAFFARSPQRRIAAQQKYAQEERTQHVKQAILNFLTKNKPKDSFDEYGDQRTLFNGDTYETRLGPDDRGEGEYTT